MTWRVPWETGRRSAARELTAAFWEGYTGSPAASFTRPPGACSDIAARETRDGGPGQRQRLVRPRYRDSALPPALRYSFAGILNPQQGPGAAFEQLVNHPGVTDEHVETAVR